MHVFFFFWEGGLTYLKQNEHPSLHIHDDNKFLVQA